MHCLKHCQSHDSQIMMIEKITKMPKEWLPQSMVDLFLLDRLFRRFWIAKPWPACLFLRHPCGMKLARIQLLLTMILDDFSFAMRHVTCLRSWKPLHIMSSPGEALDNCPSCRNKCCSVVPVQHLPALFSAPVWDPQRNTWGWDGSMVTS